MHARTVVIVEDDAMIRLDAVTLIEEAGFDVAAMGTADEALRYVWRQPMRVAAVFCDVVTPGHTSGADLARMIACHWPSILLLVTSGQNPDRMRLPASSRFLQKPWAPLDVLTALFGAKRAA